MVNFFGSITKNGTEWVNRKEIFLHGLIVLQWIYSTYRFRHWTQRLWVFPPKRKKEQLPNWTLLGVVLTHSPQQVHYIQEKEAQNEHLLDFRSGRLFRHSSDKAISTNDVGWIFVLQDGHFYASRKVAKNHTSQVAACTLLVLFFFSSLSFVFEVISMLQVTDSLPRFHHTSFVGGGRVQMAGIFKAEDGYITAIYPHSGHYRYIFILRECCSS